jgi:hypothetical protein
MHPSNGAWGGVTPRGDFMIEFYVERVKPPSRVTHATDGKTVGAEIRRDPPDGIVREFQVGVLLSQGEALALANFIKQKTEDFAKLTAVDSEKKTK